MAPLADNRDDAVDAVVVGSGPNGLAAAIELASHDLDVMVIEGHHEIGGGTRTAELTLPGFHHDVCSAVHPFGTALSYLSTLPLEHHGLQWIVPSAPAAHPLDDEPAVLHRRSSSETAAGLDGDDGGRWLDTIGWLVENADAICEDGLQPVAHLPRHPYVMARFGRHALRSARSVAGRFEDERARALFAGHAAHATTSLDLPASSAVGLVLAMTAHVTGWPIAEGGSHAITTAMAAYLRSLGGRIQTGQWVSSLDELPPARSILLDVSPSGLARLAGDALPAGRQRATRRWRHGPAVFKLDLAVSEPIPWADETVREAATVHVGGTYDEIARAEADVWADRHPSQPFLILAQPSLFDPSRAPDGNHTVWVYCHVPSGSTVDCTEAIEAQIERFAPGFRDTILARHVMTPADFEAYNPNFVGGEIGGGAYLLRQVVSRPRLLRPSHTGIAHVHLCSASTPPGAGVHGMCGFTAARAALRSDFGIRRSPRWLTAAS